MELPAILRGDSLKRLLQGAFIGFVATWIVGFQWAGWTLGSTAHQMAEQSASAAAVKVLVPFCVDKFQRDASASSNIVALAKTDSWKQATFVSDGGWATMPGSTSPDSSVARACAEMLISLQK